MTEIHNQKQLHLLQLLPCKSSGGDLFVHAHDHTILILL